MPIRINLLADALADDDLRRRDPVKRAIYAGAFVVALSLVWFSSTWLEYVIENQNFNGVEAAIDTHTNEYAQVLGNMKKTADVQKRLDALDQLASVRFLQGNLMNALQQVYVPNVQLSHMRIDQSYSYAPGVPSKTNNGVAYPGRPTSVTQHIILSMDAKDFSPNPGDQVRHFKDAISKEDYFSQNLDMTNGIRLSSESALQTPVEGKPYVMFTLECRFLDKTP